MKKFVLLLYLILFFASTTFAEVADTKLQQIMTEAGFSNHQVIQVQSMINSAQQKGLPPEAVTSKVYEGIAKHVAPERIVQALERVTSRYEYGYGLAEKLVKEKTQIAELGTTVAAGVAAGLTHQDAEKIAGSLHSRSGQVSQDEFYSLAEETMRTARDLSRQGVSSATTAEVVGEAVQKGFNASEMQTMRGSFNKQGAHGNVESLAKSYGNAIKEGVGARGLADHDRSGRGTGGMHGESSGNDHSGGSGGAGDSGGSGNSGGSEGNGSGEGSGGSDDSGHGGGCRH